MDKTITICTPDQLEPLERHVDALNDCFLAVQDAFDAFHQWAVENSPPKVFGFIYYEALATLARQCLDNADACSRSLNES